MANLRLRGNRSLESAGQTTDSKAPKNSRIFIGFGGPQAHGDSIENTLPYRRGSVTSRDYLPSRDRKEAISESHRDACGRKRAVSR